MTVALAVCCWLAALVAGLMLPVVGWLAALFVVLAVLVGAGTHTRVCCRGCRFGLWYVALVVWLAGFTAGAANAAYGSTSTVPALGFGSILAAGAAGWVIVRPDDLFGQWCPRGSRARDASRIPATHRPEHPTYIGSIRVRTRAINRAARALPAARQAIDTTAREVRDHAPRPRS